jgi:hypothetical protein
MCAADACICRLMQAADCTRPARRMLINLRPDNGGKRSARPQHKKFSAFYCLGCITRTEAAIDMQAERIHSWKSGPRDESVYENG